MSISVTPEQRDAHSPSSTSPRGRGKDPPTLQHRRQPNHGLTRSDKNTGGISDGDAAADTDAPQSGSNTKNLSPVDRNYDPYTGIPRMSSIPIDARRPEKTALD
jgi:hypothetical protein